MCLVSLITCVVSVIRSGEFNRVCEFNHVSASINAFVSLIARR
jgi:hypothetical protein